LLNVSVGSTAIIINAKRKEPAHDP
jgi:hypothetical protein